MAEKAGKNLQALDRYFDEKLRELQSGQTYQYSPSQPSLKIRITKWCLWFLVYMVLSVLPFILLIKTAMYAYLTLTMSSWTSLVVGAASVMTLLMLYSFWVIFRFSGRRKAYSIAIRVILVILLCYGGYSLLYLSSVNSKNEAIRSQYRSLNPLLRVTLSTLTLADSQLLVTDMKRTRKDYERMGLPPREQSLHYLQSSGYVHAVDIRTKGRAAWKNWSTEVAFNVLGFHTLRHVGTADHLHISLPLND